jgi:arabinose-5-phosphate isomerase
MISDVILLGRKVILQEARALDAFGNSLGISFEQTCDAILACRGTVLVTGMGKSGLVARKWASTFSSTGTRAYFVNPAEAPHGDLGVLRPEDLLVALSFSGETEELSFVLKHARENHVNIIGITGNTKSRLAQASNIIISVQVPEEACPLGLAPTTSTTLMMALGDGIAITLMQKRGFTERDFARLHPGGALGRRLWLTVENLMHSGESLPVVSLQDSMENVLLEMTRKCLGLAVVVDEGEIAGVITDGDLRRFFQSNRPLGQDYRVTASALMTKNPKTILRDALAVEAREMMEKKSILQLLVVDSKIKKLIGVVHLHDLLRAKVL